MGYKYRRAKTAPEKDALFVSVTVKLPLSVYQPIKQAAEEKQMPIPRLIAWLIDNEITDRNGAFDYPCEIPTNIFVERAYVIEAGKILRYLRKVGAQGIDQLMMARREIGVIDKTTFMLAIRELIKHSFLPVEYIYPKWITYFTHHPNYRVLAIKQSNEERRRKEIERAKKYLEKLEKGEDYGTAEENESGPLGQASPIAENSQE